MLIRQLLRCTVCFDTLPPPIAICVRNGRLGPGSAFAGRQPIFERAAQPVDFRGPRSPHLCHRQYLARVTLRDRHTVTGLLDARTGRTSRRTPCLAASSGGG